MHGLSIYLVCIIQIIFIKMKHLNNFIDEKLTINSKTKINKDIKQLSNKEKDIILQELCRYFQESCSYKGIKYDNKLILLSKFFDNNIYNMFSKLDVLEDFCDYVNLRFDINQDTLYEYIEANNDKLCKDIIKDFAKI